MIHIISQKLEHGTHRLAKWIGSGAAFSAAIISIMIWLVIGKIFHFSSTWENAFTIYISIITFLMIFIMQRSQNKELSMLHMKLNELISVTKKADNRMINAEDLTEKEILEVREMHHQIGTGDVSA